MKYETKRKLYIFLPWILLLTVLGAYTLHEFIYRRDFNPFTAKSSEADLLAVMRIHLLEAVEAEKNAVLAITDEASEDFAAQARRAADGVDSDRKEIESLIRRENLPGEAGLMNEFNVCWSQYRKLDEVILNLATQNTNLKAQKISATQCAQELQRFEENLNRIIQRNTVNNKGNQAAMLSYEALTASLKLFALHKPHIEEPNDQVMDEIERRMKSYDDSARRALGSLRKVTGQNDHEDLQNAEAAYGRFMDLTGEVLRLSRMNTNVKSTELSLGRKRLIALQCQEILANLQETVLPKDSYALPRSKKKQLE